MVPKHLKKFGCNMLAKEDSSGITKKCSALKTLLYLSELLGELFSLKCKH
jgi:hypothetical protein